jgi:hypothetical protein
LPNAAQHTLRYKTEGDYNTLRPYVSPVEYVGSKMFPGTCERCVFGSGPHSENCPVGKEESRRNFDADLSKMMENAEFFRGL